MSEQGDNEEFGAFVDAVMERLGDRPVRHGWVEDVESLRGDVVELLEQVDLPASVAVAVSYVRRHLRRRALENVNRGAGARLDVDEVRAIARSLSAKWRVNTSWLLDTDDIEGEIVGVLEEKVYPRYDPGRGSLFSYCRMMCHYHFSDLYRNKTETSKDLVDVLGREPELRVPTHDDGTQVEQAHIRDAEQESATEWQLRVREWSAFFADCVRRRFGPDSDEHRVLDLWLKLFEDLESRPPEEKKEETGSRPLATRNAESDEPLVRTGEPISHHTINRIMKRIKEVFPHIEDFFFLFEVETNESLYDETEQSLTFLFPDPQLLDLRRRLVRAWLDRVRLEGTGTPDVDAVLEAAGVPGDLDAEAVYFDTTTVLLQHKYRHWGEGQD